MSPLSSEETLGLFPGTNGYLGTNKSHAAANILVHALRMVGLFSGVGRLDTFPSACHPLYPLEMMTVGKVLE